MWLDLNTIAETCSSVSSIIPDKNLVDRTLFVEVINCLSVFSYRTAASRQAGSHPEPEPVEVHRARVVTFFKVASVHVFPSVAVAS